ncbi:UDP-3-O-acyl-N-acetylglucosamine deacetylase [Actibacterium ureilyticum]|uniref:UDP-3-O-acyl-N-acetylglucosamine deacetylase n=1 Tax=Actibacterium ureilyticum TaxID=1590614 RepID=UPI000BAAACA8|nr:UDP-3-O-acyl-N-acetylglucosamine deacetylase [Actibacterium ureilyticum]
MQTTLKNKVSFKGVGLHSGARVCATVHPASAEYGIWFRRTDLADGDVLIPARWDCVERSPLCTKLVNEAGISVSTVEHLMAALAGCGLQNALIEIDGPEVPILDGSSAQFVDAFLAAGIQMLDAPSRAIRILKPVEVREGAAWARLSPGDTLEIDFQIDFEEAAIGRQQKTLNMANGAFVRELSDSRTFCRRADVDTMQANGLALGGVPGENAVVFDGDLVESGGGLRHADEPVRHKMLDALGDLALAGAPILGRYEGHRAGHALTNKLLRALFANPEAYRVVTCDADVARLLPGAGLRHADLALTA